MFISRMFLECVSTGCLPVCFPGWDSGSGSAFMRCRAWQGPRWHFTGCHSSEDSQALVSLLLLLLLSRQTREGYRPAAGLHSRCRRGGRIRLGSHSEGLTLTSRCDPSRVSAESPGVSLVLSFLSCIYLHNLCTQRGAGTHDPETKSRTLLQLG